MDPKTMKPIMKKVAASLSLEERVRFTGQ